MRLSAYSTQSVQRGCWMGVQWPAWSVMDRAHDTSAEEQARQGSGGNGNLVQGSRQVNSPRPYSNGDIEQVTSNGRWHIAVSPMCPPANLVPCAHWRGHEPAFTRQGSATAPWQQLLVTDISIEIGQNQLEMARLMLNNHSLAITSISLITLRIRNACAWQNILYVVVGCCQQLWPSNT